MKCPICECATNVIDTVHANDENEIYRKRKCVACRHIFYTAEIIIAKDEKFKQLWVNNHRAYYERRR